MIGENILTICCLITAWLFWNVVTKSSHSKWYQQTSTVYQVKSIYNQNAASEWVNEWVTDEASKCSDLGPIRYVLLMNKLFSNLSPFFSSVQYWIQYESETNTTPHQNVTPNVHWLLWYNLEKKTVTHSYLGMCHIIILTFTSTRRNSADLQLPC